MAKPLTPEQIEALRAVPLGDMPNKIRIALALANARQADLCEGIDITPSQSSVLVNGKYGTVTIDMAQKVAQFFGCSTDDIFPRREAVA